jgi:hypothetical protein
MRNKHYTPSLSRFLVRALYHEAKAQNLPMTRLANQIVEAGLRGTGGWQKAQEHESALREGATQYHTEYRQSPSNPGSFSINQRTQ